MRQIIFLIATVFLISTNSFAEVKLMKGKTPIPRGNALHEKDITISNGKIMISLAIGTPGPWGVPSGGILDASIVRDGKVEIDRIALVDAIPNNWSAWLKVDPSVRIVENMPQRVVVETIRDWNGVSIKNTLTMIDDDDKVHIETEMVNNTTNTFTDILPSHSLWTDGGYFFDMPGLEKAGSNSQNVSKALTDWSINYDKTWSVVLHSPARTHAGYQGRDMQHKVTLKPNDTFKYESWLQFLDSGDMSNALAYEIERKKMPYGMISGEIRNDEGNPIKNAVVVVKKQNLIYMWAFGNEKGEYKFQLPVGDYKLYARSANYGPGTEQSINIKKQKTSRLNFENIQLQGKITINVQDTDTKKPIGAKIKIEKGFSPVVKFLGQNTFFTGLEPMGRTTITLVPDDYELAILSGTGFVSKPKLVKTKVKAGETKNITVSVETLISPQKNNWYGADLHHHSDILDGYTSPGYVFRAQLARRLDFILLSDHDDVSHHHEMQDLSQKHQQKFLPSLEISPSWGHIGAVNIPLGQEMTIDTNMATVKDILKNADDIGADLVVINHPFIPYGFYTALEENFLPGGYDSNFDLVEINSASPNKNWDKVVNKLYSYWDSGEKYFLSAGTDYHDVWNDPQADIRMYGYVPKKSKSDKKFKKAFMRALKAGHGYASLGPIIMPEIMFGETVKHGKGKPFKLNYKLQAVDGLKAVRLRTNKGEIVKEQKWDSGPIAQNVSFTVTAKNNSWYAIEVEDSDGSYAWSNPIWVTIK